jgi:hypothetical protein
MVYPALLPLTRTPRLPVVDRTDAPRRFKWTRPFRRKTKSDFCACAITFQTQSNSKSGYNPTISDNFHKDLTALYIVGGNISSTTIKKTHCCAWVMRLAIFITLLKGTAVRQNKKTHCCAWTMQLSVFIPLLKGTAVRQNKKTHCCAW